MDFPREPGKLFQRGPVRDDVRALKMSKKSRVELDGDLVKWGPDVVGKTEKETREHTSLPYSRARRLHAWVSRFGAGEAPSEPIGEPSRARIGKTVVVIGDAHTSPGQDPRRWRALGKFVKDLDPDHLVSLGDWNDHLSLCSQESLRERAVARLTAEVSAGKFAVEELETELVGWKGQKTITLGNHDVRPDRLSNDHPWLEGIVDVGGAHRNAGWGVVPYLDPYRLEGVRFQHYLTVAGTQRPISGKYQSLRMLERVKFSESVVVGHSHRFDYRIETNHIGRRVHSLVAGCFFEDRLEYAGEDNLEWVRGVAVLHNVVDGDYDLEWVSLGRMRAQYV